MDLSYITSHEPFCELQLGICNREFTSIHIIEGSPLEKYRKQLAKTFEIFNKGIKHITEDSRKVKEDTLFVLNPLSMPYLKSALSQKPMGILLSMDELPMLTAAPPVYIRDLEEVENVLAEDSLFGAVFLLIAKEKSKIHFYQSSLSSELYDNPGAKMEIVSVTGTNGKTSVAWLLYNIWKNLDLPCAMIGTLGVHSFSSVGARKSIGKMVDKVEEKEDLGYTTPPAELLHFILAQLYEKKIRRVVIEASSEGLDLGRIETLHTNAALFTNLGHDHLDHHKSMENYFAAKVKLFTLAEKHGARMIIGYQTLWGEKLAHMFSHYPYLEEMKHPICQKNSLSIRTSFQEWNASLVLQYLSKEHAKEMHLIHEVLKEIPQLPGRFEKMEHTETIHSIVDYAHTPDALETLLDEVRKLGYSYSICVFGCGGDRDKAKRPLMGKIAGEYSKCIIITNDNPRNEDAAQIRQEILAGLAMQSSESKENGFLIIKEIANRKESIYEAVRIAKKFVDSDKNPLNKVAIIVAGKGHENVQIMKDQMLHFSDKECLQEAFFLYKRDVNP